MRNRKSLVKEADRVFSLYVRNRGETYGYNHCYTCNAYLPVEELQAGHFLSRRFQNVRWNPLNVWPQCNHCNVDLRGNLAVYEKKLIAQYSLLAVEGLKEVAYTGSGLTDWAINEIIEKYKST